MLSSCNLDENVAENVLYPLIPVPVNSGKVFIDTFQSVAWHAAETSGGLGAAV